MRRTVSRFIRLPRPRVTSPLLATALLAASVALVPLTAANSPAQASQ
jgi:hypothetical protein